MEKRAKAQQELFRKNNYNPLSGCWLMFLQLPVFIGLYRSLAVDIELRQAPLIPGIEWASNLAGPDMLFYWEKSLPAFFAFFTSETGMLGPYLNLLPICTMVLFLVHQQLFTPPATDEQTRMQMQMMKFMTIFIGFMFFKVASGLCLYFIASSLWSVAERVLVPKPKKPDESMEVAASKPRKPDDKGPNIVERLRTKLEQFDKAQGSADRRRQRRNK
jgi:YidC/Oxa1 family membrane protein insertase